MTDTLGTISIINRSGQQLALQGMNLTLGNWSTYPPNSIPISQNGSAIIAWTRANGTEGSLTYNVDKGSTVGVSFKIPPAAGASTSATINTSRSTLVNASFNATGSWT
ncbi:hypothetical protein FRB90_009083, partial [Tulasnella sp. 427]